MLRASLDHGRHFLGGLGKHHHVRQRVGKVRLVVARAHGVVETRSAPKAALRSSSRAAGNSRRRYREATAGFMAADTRLTGPSFYSGSRAPPGNNPYPDGVGSQRRCAETRDTAHPRRAGRALRPPSMRRRNRRACALPDPETCPPSSPLAMRSRRKVRNRAQLAPGAQGPCAAPEIQRQRPDQAVGGPFLRVAVGQRSPRAAMVCRKASKRCPVSARMNQRARRCACAPWR